MDTLKTPQYSGMSEHSTISTPDDLEDWLTSLARDFPANRSQSQVNEQGQTTPVICGPPPSSAFAWLDPDTHYWRTSQASLLPAISGPSSPTFPKAGMMLDGVCYQQRKWERRISEIGCGLWHTPTASENRETWERRYPGGKDRKHPIPNLAAEVQVGEPYSRMAKEKRWPTPTPDKAQTFPTPASRDWRSGLASEATHAKNSRPLSEYVGGKLSPDWVELLQGWPKSWTSLDPLPELGEWGGWGEGGGKWPTPTTQEVEHPDAELTATGRHRSRDNKSSHSMNLADTVKDAHTQSPWEQSTPRVVTSCPDRVSRLKAIGNGQVPVCAAMAWRLLTEVMG